MSIDTGKTSFRDYFHARLARLPERTILEFPRERIPAGARAAAVLMGFWPTEQDGIELVLTRRTDTVSSHRGQVSFPGGRVEENETYAAAALRETYEELGIAPETITIMGRLDDAWSRYGHHVVPFIGWLEKRPELLPNPHEVAEVLIADMETILRPETACRHVFELNGETHSTQAFKWDGGYVWGLSADLLLELVLWIRDVPSNRGSLRQQRMEKYSL